MIRITVVVCTLLLLVPSQAALAEAGGPASCMGHESSAISPPGSSEEIPGGRPGLNAFAKATDAPPGALKSAIAKLHEGSHEACDEALGG